MQMTSRKVVIAVLTALVFMWLYADRAGVLFWYLVGIFAIYIMSEYTRIKSYILMSILILPLCLIKFKVSPIVGFLGISFVTFRCIDFLLSRRGRHDRSIVQFFTYVFFPPLILAGPMYRYRDFERDFNLFVFNFSGFFKAIECVAWGVIYKFLISELIKDYGLQDDLASFWGVVVDAIFYSLYLFFDFAGYSKIAIGVGLLFGFVLPENFKAPFLAKNPSDFWQRWHISLSSWLRDVVFMPLVGVLMKIGYFRQNYFVAVCLASFVTLILMGIWNGVEWKYVASGAMFGCYSVFYLSMNHWRAESKLIRFGFENGVVVAAFRVIHIIGCVVALYVFGGRWERFV
jgi:membrane protein involved in D-alanine export